MHEEREHTMIFAPTFAALPACTFVERTFAVEASTLHHLALLYPLPASLQRAVLKRQVEFLAGRVCAQQAIAALTGDKPVAIPAQPDRAPTWPAGIVGSITHTASYAAALVAADTHYRGIGIDCEVILSPENLTLQRHICVTHELETLQAVHRDCPPEWLLTLVFSAKESLFKCLYRHVQKIFGFDAARLVTLDRARQTFIMQLEKDLTPHLRTGSQWSGHFQCHNHLLMTVMLYPGAPNTAATAQRVPPD
jgi:enterobactin synthetase component D